MQNTKLCPFRIKSLYDSGRNTGAGYPDCWEKDSDFKPCIKEQCMAYWFDNALNLDRCSLIEK